MNPETEHNADARLAFEARVSRLIAARKPLPFLGKGGGKSKLHGCCPRCGGYGYGYHDGRWKRCAGCGYDRIEEMLFEAVRADAKRGRPVESADVERALEYHERVYGC